MVNNNLDIGKTYTLKYNSPWGDYDVTDVKVSSITNDKEASTYSKDSIFSEYFSKYGLGLASYVKTMNACPDIYVCEPVVSRDPVTYDPKLLMIIPKAIIDFGRSEELLVCDNVTLKISGLLTYNQLTYQKGLFYEGLINNLTTALKELEEFGNVIVSVSSSSTDVLKPLTEYTDYDIFRKKTFEDAKAATLLNKNRDAVEFREVLNKYNNLIELTEETKREKLSVVNNRIKYENIIRILSENNEVITTFEEIKTKTNELFNGLDVGNIVVNDPTYNILKTTIKSDIDKLL